MNAIEQILTRVPVTEGFVSLHLVDAGTGQILATIEPPDPPRSTTDRDRSDRDATDRSSVTDALAMTATDVVRLFSAMTTAHDVDEDLEDLVVTLTGHHHLVRPLPPSAGAESAFLLLTLDRSRSNLALARHLLLDFEAQLVA